MEIAPNTLINNCPQRVKEKLEKLNRGDCVVLLWVDASESWNVEPNKEIPNHNVETVCTSVGTFHGLQKGSSYSDTYILLMKDFYEGMKTRVQAVPLCLVKSLEIYDAKRPLMKSVRRRIVLRFKDGSVKRIGF